MSSGPGVSPAGRSSGKGKKSKGRRALIALLLATTALTSLYLLFGHKSGPAAPATPSGVTNATTHAAPHQLPTKFSRAHSDDATLVSTQPAAPVCPEEMVIIRGPFTISGDTFKTYTTTLNDPVANVDKGHFYSFFVPGSLADAFNTDAKKGPVKVTVANIDPKEANSCPAGTHAAGRITSVSPSTPSS